MHKAIIINGDEVIKTVGDFCQRFLVNPHSFKYSEQLCNDDNVDLIDLEAFFDTRMDIKVVSSVHDWEVTIL